jgi:hypothetical protein
MTGGCARNIEDTVDIHFSTVRIAAEFARERANHGAAA